jgi:hypothetical protein
MPIVIPPGAVPRLPPQVFERYPLSHRWVGWDGSIWLLSDPSSGVRLLRGYRGTGLAAPQRYTTTRPGLAGTRRRGSRMPEKEAVWNLAVYTAPDKSWWDYDAAFWRTMDYDRPGVWEVTAPGTGGAAGRTRRLKCAWADGGDPNITVDPGVAGFQMYEGITLVAEDQPYWTGDPITTSFDNTAVGDFFATATDAFVIRISSAATIGRATISNPGDVDSYPVYTIRGPTTGTTTLNLGGKTTQYVGLIPDGQTRTIDTRPGYQTITDQAGTDRITDMGAISFAPVLAGARDVPLAMTLVGSGSIDVRLDTLYRRAW